MTHISGGILPPLRVEFFPPWAKLDASCVHFPLRRRPRYVVWQSFDKIGSETAENVFGKRTRRTQKPNGLSLLGLHIYGDHYNDRFSAYIQQRATMIMFQCRQCHTMCRLQQNTMQRTSFSAQAAQRRSRHAAKVGKPISAIIAVIDCSDDVFNVLSLASNEIRWHADISTIISAYLFLWLRWCLTPTTRRQFPSCRTDCHSGRYCSSSGHGGQSTQRQARGNIDWPVAYSCSSLWAVGCSMQLHALNARPTVIQWN